MPKIIEGGKKIHRGVYFIRHYEHKALRKMKSFFKHDENDIIISGRIQK